MKVINTVDETRGLIKQQKSGGKIIGFVPTMGALHEGHLSLIKKSVSECDYTVVSIFVNPIQFGPNEDLDTYPKPLEKDIELARAAGADLLFAPKKKDIFEDEILTYVDIEKLQDNLCGKKRPGHFKGVCTIVTKLFNIALPDRAYFGKKDIQQLYIIKKMTRDLNFDVAVIGCPIIREEDGLAMSSRNLYLNETERRDALILYTCLKKAKQMIDTGITSAQQIIEALQAMIEPVNTARIDYINIVDEHIMDVTRVETGNILALAVFIGNTRLIDNYIVGDEL